MPKGRAFRRIAGKGFLDRIRIVTPLEENEPIPLRSCIRWWSSFAKVVVGGTLLFWLLCTFVAQSHLLVAPLTYLPQVLIGPVVFAIALPGWWWGRRLFWIGVTTAIGFQASLMGWPSSPKSTAQGPVVRVAFVNRGDQDFAKWDQWIQKQAPDLIGLTDLKGREAQSLAVGQPAVAGLPYLMRIGEHALASRYPFKGTQVIRPDVSAGGTAKIQYLPAARFEVDAPGGPVAVYVVHVRSPRDALSKYRSIRMWNWTLFGVPAHVSPSITIGHYWREQKHVIDGLLKRIEAESIPTIVLGDWNLPDSGPRYRCLTRMLEDAHRVAGHGPGYTFPGDVSHWAALSRPWMRIDYILTNQGHWETRDCQVQSQEEAGRSQHRALMAILARTP